MPKAASRALRIEERTLRTLVGWALTDRAEYGALEDLCDKVGGRLAGTPACASGERWATRRMREIGLKSVAAQAFRTATWQRGSCSVEVVKPRIGPISALAHGFAPGDVEVERPIIVAGCGLKEEIDQLGRRVRGKLALVRNGAPDGKRAPHRSEKFAWLRDAGAGGMVLLSGLPGLQPQTGMCADAEAPIPSVGITLEDGERLLRAAATGSGLAARLTMHNTVGTGKVASIIGEIPGRTRPEEVVVVGGHFDSWDVAQGAVDNGTGCAVVLGVARALMALGRTPRRTVRFALWAAEEIGLVGSGHYVRREWKRMDRHVAYLNFDMPGDPERLLLSGRPGEAAVLDEVASHMTGLGVVQPHSTGICLATDLKAFLLAGVPVLSVLGGLKGAGGSCYHTASDTFDKVDLGGLQRTTACAAALTWALADADAPPFARHTGTQVREALERDGQAAVLERPGCELAEGL